FKSGRYRMIQLDTDALKKAAARFRYQMQDGFSFKSSLGYQRHQQIQSGLWSIVSYLNETAALFENNEMNRFSNHWDVHTSFYPNVYSFVTQRDQGATAKITASKAMVEKQFQKSGKYATGNLNLSLGKIRAEGQAEFSLWKDKIVSPKLALKAGAVASVLDAQVYGRVGTGNIYADVRAKGTVGALYANATAVLSLDEQTLDLGVGGSALKGEVSASFSLFGIKVTATAEGSVGSAELNMSYHHSNREWEFGSKLGFIVGTGFKIKVQY
ncbi:MAG: hypothetical protein J6D18_03400, partial [Erysipelotrichaceae bacterium]|nr:hypothetical protein [Erysipelotrichaceae bacterium]